MVAQPNIVVIVSDDHGYADISALGHRSDVQTPGLDRMLTEGMACANAYASAPICSPSRAGLISGRYQQRWGSLWFDSAQFPPEGTPTIAQALQDRGYRTGYFGKVHYGDERVGDRACPPHHGFDTSYYGLAGQSYGRLHYTRHSRQAQGEYGEAAVPMAVQPMLSGDDPVEHEGFLTAELGRRARDFMTSVEEPFFAVVAFNAVHNFCWQLPPQELAARGLPAYHDWDPQSGTSYGQWYDDAIVPNLPHGREYYCAQLELMDAEIASMLTTLDEAGLAEDTLVVYTTDNGGSTCNYADNSPLRGTKYTLWEGGIRVPLLLRWPGRITGGSVRTELTSLLDLYPTLLAAAGADLTQVQSDGLNMFDHHGGHAALHWDAGFQWAVRSGPWKYSVVDSNSVEVQELAELEHAPISAGTFLADLESDIGETEDLSASYPEVVQRLSAMHARWRADIGLSRPG
ncbi:MAG: sulfatase [Beutenbergiaceae bacterium]